MNGFDAMMKAQRDITALASKQLSAMQSGVDASRDLLNASKAMTDMAEANMAAWRGWLGMWGMKG